MQKKSKNIILFVIFTIIILITIVILMISVYTSKSKGIEQYKISSNSIVYDEEGTYITIGKPSVVKKEWDNKYYLNLQDKKYSLGDEAVFYNELKNEIYIYGTIYQVYSNGEIEEKQEKIGISNLNDSQFFKLNDRKYLIIGNQITIDDFSTKNYLIVLIDKAGNATLENNNVNIKTINPILIKTNDLTFDAANEKLIVSKEEIDLKKINGSTNEYVKKEKKEEQIDNKEKNNNSSSNATTNNGNGNSTNNYDYNEILNQIIHLSGIISGTGITSSSNLYKNVSLLSLTPGTSYIDVKYAIVDPEDKYLSVFLELKDDQSGEFIEQKYYLSKQYNNYRINGLIPNKNYTITLNYITRDSTKIIEADSVVVNTLSNLATIKVLNINNIEKNLTYYLKINDSFSISEANVSLYSCLDNSRSLITINMNNWLQEAYGQGYTGIINLNDIEDTCLILKLDGISSYNKSYVNANIYHKFMR